MKIDLNRTAGPSWNYCLIFSIKLKAAEQNEKEDYIFIYIICDKDKCPRFSFKIPTFLEVRPLNPSRVTVLFLEGLGKLLGFSKEALQTDDVEEKIVFSERAETWTSFFFSPKAYGAILSIAFHGVPSVGTFKPCSTREKENVVP